MNIGDHICGVPGLSKKYQIPVYITPGTLRATNIPLEPRLTYGFNTAEPVILGRLKVQAFVKYHDASDPHSFVIAQDDCRVGVFTDLGKVCDNLLRHFSTCHAAFLESNYCEEMLARGSYPYHLKKRITGGLGHLSNRQALELVTTHAGPLQYLVLSHLSKNNNDPQLVERLFREHVSGSQVVVASRYGESPVFRVTPTVLPQRNVRTNTGKKSPNVTRQLSLF